MRGPEDKQDDLFSYVSMEDRIHQDHPLRRIKSLLELLLRDSFREFDKLYTDIGRRSIPPECLLKASLPQMLYSIRSERFLVDEINYNLLFRWFIGLKMDDEVWDHSTFTKKP